MRQTGRNARWNGRSLSPLRPERARVQLTTSPVQLSATHSTCTAGRPLLWIHTNHGEFSMTHRGISAVALAVALVSQCTPWGDASLQAQPPRMPGDACTRIRTPLSAPTDSVPNLAGLWDFAIDMGAQRATGTMALGRLDADYGGALTPDATNTAAHAPWRQHSHGCGVAGRRCAFRRTPRVRPQSHVRDRHLPWRSAFHDAGNPAAPTGLPASTTVTRSDDHLLACHRPESR
jgi:hypothetical protein